MVERGLGEVVDGQPARVRWHVWVDTERDEPEIRGRDLTFARAAARVAVRAELFDVRDLPHVDLGRQVAQDRRLERLPGGEDASR